MDITRRSMLQISALGALAVSLDPHGSAAQEPRAPGPSSSAVEPLDRVFIANEDSNTIAVIDPRSNAVETTINLTSFDEDPRPPFRFAVNGVTLTHAAMIQQPLYHGAIGIHGLAPSPDNRLLAVTGRGSSNVYLIDTVARRVVGNLPNPHAGPTTNAERVTSGILIGREPHEPTFTRNGKELWVAVRGEDRLAIVEVEAAIKESGGVDSGALRGFIKTVNGPTHVWFSADGALAFVASGKSSRVDVLLTNPDAKGLSRPGRRGMFDIAAQDAVGATPFLKTSPDGGEVWMCHNLADRVSAWPVHEPYRALDGIALGNQARPNCLEFVENSLGRAVYVSLARVDAGGPEGVASSQIAVIDRGLRAGGRRLVSTFFTHGREAHGLWTNPDNTLLYVAHEQDELPGTPSAGQTVASAFDVRNPFIPRFITQIPLGSLKLPSGDLRNKKSIGLVYVRPGARSQGG